jgi:hypothetical protein
MRGVFKLDEPSGPRWELALDLLGRGEPFSLGMVTFRRASEDVVEASVASTWQLQNVTEARARDDLEPARSRTEALLADDPGFRSVVGASRIEYVLVDDYEIGAVAICRLADDEIQWLIDRE